MIVKWSRSLLAKSPSAAVLWQRYNHQLTVSPIPTKCVTAGLIAVTADLVCQINFPLDPEAKKRPPLERVQWRRLLNFAFLSTFLSPPIVHWWYGLLSTRIPGDTVVAAVKRVALDQTLCAPAFLVVFLAANLLMDGKIHSIGDKLKADFLPTLVANYYVWIPAQFVNFMFVPPPLRVLWANFVGFFWSIYLSNAANKAPTVAAPPVEVEAKKEN